MSLQNPPQTFFRKMTVKITEIPTEYAQQLNERERTSNLAGRRSVGDDKNPFNTSTQQTTPRDMENPFGLALTNDDEIQPLTTQ